MSEEEIEELSAYKRKHLEIEKKKLETLQAMRKDMKHHQRMENIHKTIEELGVDKEDVVFLVRYILEKIEDYKGETAASEGLKDVMSELVDDEGDHNIHLEFKD